MRILEEQSSLGNPDVDARSIANRLKDAASWLAANGYEHASNYVEMGRAEVLARLAADQTPMLQEVGHVG